MTKNATPPHERDRKRIAGSERESSASPPKLSVFRSARFAFASACGLTLCTAVVLKLLHLVRRENTAAALTSDLRIEGQLSARVGEVLRITVFSSASRDGQTVALILIGSYGPRLFRAVFSGHTARFLIPSSATRYSGVVTLIASAPNARGSASLRLEPDEPVEPVTPLVGARSITADGRHWSMGVVVPFDRFGNVLADGTRLALRALHPDGSLEALNPEIEHQLAWTRIYSHTVTGKTVVSATVGMAHGPDATLLEVPGWPVAFSVMANPGNAVADGRRFVALKSDVLRDRYGNDVLDGTLVTFVVRSASGDLRFMPSFTIEGAAIGQLQAPREAVALTVAGEVYATGIRPMQLQFSPGLAIRPFAIVAELDANGDVALKAGPLLGPLDQFIPDGIPVNFGIRSTTGEEARVAAESDAGYARATTRFPRWVSGEYRVSATVGERNSEITVRLP